MDCALVTSLSSNFSIHALIDVFIVAIYEHIGDYNGWFIHFHSKITPASKSWIVSMNNILQFHFFYYFLHPQAQWANF